MSVECLVVLNSILQGAVLDVDSQFLENIVDLATILGPVVAEVLQPSKMFACGFEAVFPAVENYVMYRALKIVE